MYSLLNFHCVRLPYTYVHKLLCTSVQLLVYIYWNALAMESIHNITNNTHEDLTYYAYVSDST